MKKRLLCLLLAIIVALGSVSVVAFADETPGVTVTGGEGTGEGTTDPVNPDDPENPVTPTDPENPTNPDDPAEPEEPVVLPTDPVAIVYLCSTWTGILPHIFVYFENITEHDIQVGAYTCPKGEGVSLGSFGMTVSDGAGVYYNVECYRNRDKEKIGGFLHIQHTVTAKQLEEVSEYIKSVYFWDPLIINCCFFAIQCWNKSGGEKMFPMTVLPNIARANLRSRGATSENINMFVPTPQQVYKQNRIPGTRNPKLDVVTKGSLS